MKRIWAVIALAAVWQLNAQTPPTEKKLSFRFQGRDVILIDPGMKDGFEPNGPASVCIEGPPLRQCFTMPEGYGRAPAVKLVEMRKDDPLLVFSAETDGVSGFGVQFAFLRSSEGKELDNVLPGGARISDQSRSDFLREPAISDHLIFVTAQYKWGPSEAHLDSHRFIITAYVWIYSSLTDSWGYYADDEYLTVSKYDSESDDILARERPEIVRRLTIAKKARAAQR
jgi:hypothetical protein